MSLSRGGRTSKKGCVRTFGSVANESGTLGGVKCEELDGIAYGMKSDLRARACVREREKNLVFLFGRFLMRKEEDEEGAHP